MIVGIGELLWDIFPDGRKVAGGAPFNFAFHCQQLGHEAAIVSRVGDDELGHELREEVKRLGLTDEFIQTDFENPTGTVRVTVDAAGQPSYEIVKDVAWDFIEWTDKIEAVLPRIRALCFGTLASRNVGTRTTVQRLVLAVKGASTVVCDINLRPTGPGLDFSHWAFNNCDWLKMNRDELSTFMTEDWFLRPRAVAMLDHEERVLEIVTKGSGGCFVDRMLDRVHIHEPSVPVNVIDTVGAGDAFTAAMVCLHLEGRPLQDCARFANYYAARVCEHQGGTPRIDRSEVERVAFGG